MKRAAIILAATACMAAAADDHAILGRAFAGGRDAQFEHDLYGGKAAVYRPVTLDVRIVGVAGQDCESRFSSNFMTRTVDWGSVRGIELGEAGGKTLIWLRIGTGTSASKIILQFASREEATPAFLAMERLQAACRSVKISEWP